MDVATVRAEIKAWEHNFKATHSRTPSVQDIKAQPAIAAKYKLYKSLTKAAASDSLSKPPACPSTPPRSAPRQHLPSSSIIPKSRATNVDPPVVTSNPFSPVKNKKKLLDDHASPQRASHQSRQNPFATPTKPKDRPHATRRSPSPDPFPPIQPLVTVQRTPTASAADRAVTRARKRLRGEPVSPSPVKEKRPRVASRAALSFNSHAALFDGPDASDGDDGAADLNDTIIADTPMKPRTGGRNFKVLFDDAQPSGEKRPVKALSSRKKTSSSSHNIFAGAKRERSRALTPSSDEEEDWSLKPRLKSLGASASRHTKSAQTKGPVNGRCGIPKALVPSKNNLWSDVGPQKPALAPSRTASTNPSSRPSNKRTLPDDLDDAGHDQVPLPNTFLNIPLIPPSPPPPGASKPSVPKYAEKGKGKAAAFSRKKAKLLQDSGATEDEDTNDEDDIHVKEIDPLSHPSKGSRELDPDSDWEAHWRAPPDPDDLALNPASTVDSGRVEINLPDELQRILAISPGKAKETDEARVVRGLLYGRRENHYDPSKGGEIWDVGEDSEHATGTEEEWESEPVPWEVGEL